MEKFKAPQFVINEFVRHGIDYEISYEYWSYPYMFGSTSGPHGVIGGAAMTTYQVEAYVSPLGTVYVCDGKVRFCKKAFNLGWP